MKEIKDYLHLYLGCELQTVDGNGINLGHYYPEVWTEEGMAEANGVNVLFKSGALKNKVYVMNFPQVQPILRPLSDITEEEAIVLASLSEWEQHFRDVKTYRNAFNDIIVTWDGMLEMREEFNATGELFYCPEQFQWLLKNGFDLFELIFYGLAIDKTTLKQAVKP